MSTQCWGAGLLVRMHAWTADRQLTVLLDGVLLAVPEPVVRVAGSISQHTVLSRKRAAWHPIPTYLMQFCAVE